MSDEPAVHPRGQRAAIVLAGGRGSRLGGVDKASVKVGGRMLIEHVLAAIDGASPIVVVGPPHLNRSGVTLVREDPPFSGPVAGTAAALDPLADADATSETWLLACDLPHAADIVAQLAPLPIPDDADGIALEDAGRPQWLAGRYRIQALRAAVDALPEAAGAAMKQLVSGIRLHLVPDRSGASADLDTWQDIDHYRHKEDPHG